MGTAAHDLEQRPGWLSQALKELRRRRRLRQPEVAARMGMRPRTFEHFEAGKGPLYIDRIHDFGRALGVDPHAILMALEIGSPEFAVRCSENKLVTIIVMALQDFDEATGDAITQLDAQTLRASFERLFRDLGDLARARAALGESWLKPPDTPGDVEPGGA
jgi:transcriptional regulator with XRE-family HTH domain